MQYKEKRGYIRLYKYAMYDFLDFLYKFHIIRKMIQFNLAHFYTPIQTTVSMYDQLQLEHVIRCLARNKTLFFSAEETAKCVSV